MNDYDGKKYRSMLRMKGVFGLGGLLPVWAWVFIAAGIVVLFGGQLIGVASFVGSMISSAGASLFGGAVVAGEPIVTTSSHEVLPFCSTQAQCTTLLAAHGLTAEQISALGITCSNSVCSTNEVATYEKK